MIIAGASRTFFIHPTKSFAYNGFFSQSQRNLELNMLAIGASILDIEITAIAVVT